MKGFLFLVSVGLAVAPVCGQVRYDHPDHLESSSGVTDLDGKVIELTSYTPFGEISYWRPVTTDKSHFLYTGQEKDAASDLYDYGARYYDPTLSQFVSVDPVEGNPPYAYANHNPLIFIDPEGRDPQEPDINDWLLTPAMRQRVESFLQENGRFPTDEEFSRMEDTDHLVKGTLQVLAVLVVLKAGTAFGMPRGSSEELGRTIIATYERVGTLAGTAREMGVSEDTVRRHLKSSGITANRIGRYPSIPPEEALRLRARYRELGSVLKVAKETGRSPASVWKCVTGEIGPPFSPEEIEAITSKYAELGDVNKTARAMHIPPKAVRRQVPEAANRASRGGDDDWDW